MQCEVHDALVPLRDGMHWKSKAVKNESSACSTRSQLAVPPELMSHTCTIHAERRSRGAQLGAEGTRSSLWPAVTT